MKKSLALIIVLATSSSIVLSMNEAEIISLITHGSNTQKPFSLDEYIESYDPGTCLLHGACSKILFYGKSLIKQIELLNRALNAKNPKEKQD